MNDLFLLFVYLCATSLMSSAAYLDTSAPAAPLTKSPSAQALIAQILAANPIEGDLVGTKITGTIRIGQSTDDLPLTVYTVGRRRSRFEITYPTGVAIRIVKDQSGSYQSPSGSIRKLSNNNLLAGNDVLPTLSLLRDFASSNIQTEDLGETSGLHRIAVSWSDADSAALQAYLLKWTRTIYTIDSRTLRVVGEEYVRCGEDKSDYLTRYRVTYAGYASLGGFTLPTIITTYVGEQTISTVLLTGFSVGTAADDSSFTLPEATR
jgi:hypothetical protein